MGINIKISNRHIIFQSFSSIGPMLDFVALLPVMGIFAGIYLPEATIVAFLISVVTLIPVIGFSSRIFSNQGYVSYVSESLGKYMGRVSGMISLWGFVPKNITMSRRESMVPIDEMLLMNARNFPLMEESYISAMRENQFTVIMEPKRAIDE